MPTVCEIAEANYPEQYKGNKIQAGEGKSLFPIFEGKQREEPEAVYWSHMGNNAVRMGKWKLILAGGQGKWALYDMSVDRTELNDVDNENPEIVEKLKANYTVWAKRSYVKSWPLKEI